MSNGRKKSLICIVSKQETVWFQVVAPRVNGTFDLSSSITVSPKPNTLATYDPSENMQQKKEVF